MLCAVEDVQERAHAELSEWAESHIAATIEAVSARIEAETERVFVSQGPETRVYEAQRDAYVEIEDAAVLTEVAYGTAVYTVTTAYRARLNAGRGIVALDRGPWRAGDLVRVVAEFAYGTSVPRDVWDASVAWTIRTLKMADGAYQDTTAIPEMGELVYSRAIPADVGRVLARYRRVTPVWRVG